MWKQKALVCCADDQTICGDAWHIWHVSEYSTILMCSIQLNYSYSNCEITIHCHSIDPPTPFNLWYELSMFCCQWISLELMRLYSWHFHTKISNKVDMWWICFETVWKNAKNSLAPQKMWHKPWYEEAWRPPFELLAPKCTTKIPLITFERKYWTNPNVQLACIVRIQYMAYSLTVIRRWIQKKWKYNANIAQGECEQANREYV